MNELRKFQLMLGPPLLLVISLWSIWTQTDEQSRRAKVLAEGREVSALVTSAIGDTSVKVVWSDAAGRERAGNAHTGKPFARLTREAGQRTAQEVRIKYVETPGFAPVILSQVAERDRINSFWLTTSAGFAVTMAVVMAVFGVAYGLSGRRRTPVDRV